MQTKAEAADAKRFVYLAAAISALGGMLFGYDIGVISGAILFIKKDFSLSAGMEEIVVSSVLLGSLVGAAAGGVLADRLGRRKLLIVTAMVFGLGAIGAALAPGTAWLVVARVVAGAAIGIASFVAPLYISEIAPVDIRGKLVSINQVALTSGIVISYLVDYAFAGSQAWRWMFAMAVIPAAAFGIGLMFIPDSPRWLAGRGHVDQARAVLKRIRPSGTGGGRTQRDSAKRGAAEGELVRAAQSAPAIGDDRGRRTGHRAANHRHQHGHLLRPDYFQVRRLIFRVGGDSGQRRSRSRQRRLDSGGHATDRPGRAAAALVGQPGGNGAESVRAWGWRFRFRNCPAAWDGSRWAASWSTSVHSPWDWGRFSG